MRISVITVCFNSAAYIADALKSIDGQTWQDIEHIVVDGASQDDTLDIVKAHRQPWRRVVSEPDRGIYDAMNKGIRLATGDWIGFLNADDLFAHDRVLELIAGAAMQDQRVNAIYGDLVYVRQDDLSKVLRYWRSSDFARSRLRFGWMPPHPTFYVRANRLAEIGSFNDSFRIAADYDFMLRCLNGRETYTAYVPEVLVRMRVGGASNRSLSSLAAKSREDLQSLRAAGFAGWPTLVCKNLRKIPQFFRSV